MSGEWPVDAGQQDQLERAVAAERNAMLELLERLTLAESPSSVPESQPAVQRIVAGSLAELGFRPFSVGGANSGGHLYARPEHRTRGAPAQLLLGHYDTVWPLGTLESMPFEVDGDIVRGPGVFDMKGGLVQMITALKVLKRLGHTPPLTPLVFVNSDEEIGSHESGRYIRMLARRVKRAYVLEPSLGPEGALKTTRKGIGRFTVTVYGKAAHAGLDPEGGASAIVELAYVIQQLHALNDSERGITVNVGTVDGGLRPNVVAPHSRAVADVRVRTQEDAERVVAAIHAIEPQTPGVRLRIEGRIGRPALEPTERNRALWQQARALGERIGLTLTEVAAGGGSDGNTTSQYTATLDGLGPVGDGAHAPHEMLRIDDTLRRTVLLALLIMAPALEQADERRRA